MQPGLMPGALAMIMAAAMLSACDRAGDRESASSSQSDRKTDTVNVTREVVQRHLETFGAGDLEGVLADYADDAVMFTPSGPIKGKAALRTAFQQFIAEWGQPGTTFSLTAEHYDGDHGYINWKAETGANVYEYGVDGFTVRDGKIVAQFFGAKAQPKTTR